MRKKNTFSSFISASFLVLMISLAARLLGLFKEMIVAKEIGLSVDLDVLYLSMLVPLYLVTTVTNPLSSSFIPVFNQLENKDRLKAQEFFSSVFSWVLIGLIGLAFLLVVLSNVLAVLLDIPERSVGLFKEFTILFSVLLVAQGVGNYLLAFIENRKLFSLTSLSAIASSAAICGFLMIDNSVSGIAHGMLLGAVLFLFIEIVFLLKKGDVKLGFRLSLPSNHFSFRKQYSYLFFASLFMGSTFVVDQIMASNLGAQHVSGLNYGFRLVSMFTGLASLALGSVALPFFSKMIAKKETKELKSLVFKILILTFLSSLPVIIFIFMFGDSLVQFLFERGRFSNENTAMVGEIFKWYSLQLPFYVGGIVLVKLISSFQKNRSILFISFLNLVLNIVLNLVFIDLWGIKGIAISTSCVYGFSFLLLFFKAKPLLKLSQTL